MVAAGSRRVDLAPKEGKTYRTLAWNVRSVSKFDGRNIGGKFFELIEVESLDAKICVLRD